MYLPQQRDIKCPGSRLHVCSKQTEHADHTCKGIVPAIAQKLHTLGHHQDMKSSQPTQYKSLVDHIFGPGHLNSNIHSVWVVLAYKALTLPEFLPPCDGSGTEARKLRSPASSPPVTSSGIPPNLTTGIAQINQHA